MPQGKCTTNLYHFLLVKSIEDEVDDIFWTLLLSSFEIKIKNYAKNSLEHDIKVNVYYCFHK